MSASTATMGGGGDARAAAITVLKDFYLTEHLPGQSESEFVSGILLSCRRPALTAEEVRAYSICVTEPRGRGQRDLAVTGVRSADRATVLSGGGAEGRKVVVDAARRRYQAALVAAAGKRFVCSEAAFVHTALRDAKFAPLTDAEAAGLGIATA